MKHTIRELFLGETQPYFNEQDSEFKDKLEEIIKDLTPTFNDKQKELYKSFKIARHNHEREITYKNFEFGFELACKLIFEGLK